MLDEMFTSLKPYENPPYVTYGPFEIQGEFDQSGYAFLLSVISNKSGDLLFEKIYRVEGPPSLSKIFKGFTKELLIADVLYNISKYEFPLMGRMKKDIRLMKHKIDLLIKKAYINYTLIE